MRLATELYGSDDLQFDDDAKISECDDGVWVQGWRWLSSEEIGPGVEG